MKSFWGLPIASYRCGSHSKWGVSSCGWLGHVSNCEGKLLVGALIQIDSKHFGKLGMNMGGSNPH